MDTVIQATDLQNKSGSTGKKKDRLFIISFIIIATFCLYILRLFKMQVIEGAGYLRQSQTISQRSKTIVAQRGEIFDRNADSPLVINKDSFAVDLTPGDAGDKYDTVAARLAQYLGISKTEIDLKIPISIRNSFQAVEIKSNVTFSEVSDIAENISDLPGVSWRSKPIRDYLQTGSMSHVLGYVGDITTEELKVLYNKGYDQNSIIGKTGIEKQYDSILKGTPGLETRTVDVRGKNISSTTRNVQQPVLGSNIVLTIDTQIQTLVEEALGPRVGAAVVLKPASGEILAMVSYPYFDSNIFSSGNYASEFARIEATPNNPLLNRTINASYPPASTFKVIMSTALLSEGTFPADKEIECTGELDYGGRTWKCHIKKPGHGYLDLKNGLAQSCNIYYWTIGRDYLGVERIASYANQFGYGEPLEIDLPNSTDGFIPTAEWKERRYHEKWMNGDTMNMSIGQSYTLVTPLHVADMMAMVVNSGTIYKPHLLKEIRDPVTNEIIEEVQPTVLHSMDIDESIWQEIREDLRYTVTDGSAVSALRNKTVKMAGKTGTAEVSGYKDSWHSWFVAYGPYDAPPEDTIVLVVLVEAVNPWEWWAPYASNIIFQGIFANQTYDEAVDALGFRYLVKPIGRQE